MTTSIDKTRSNDMTTSEKIAALRDLTGLNQNRFAKLIGVAPSTMTRLERGTPNAPSLDTLQKLVDTFDEVTLEWLQDEANERLPAKLTTIQEHLLPNTEEDHEGKRFRAFVAKNKPVLNQYIIAEQMGVSRNQIGSYYNTIRFRNTVQQSLLTALRALLNRNVTAEEVFGLGKRAEATPTNLIAVPRIPVADRTKLNAEFLNTVQASFMPAIKPETAMYAPKQAVTPERLRLAYAIEVGNNDRMESLYFPGYWVLGIRMESSEYAKLYDGVVAVVTNDGEFLLKKVLANNLRTTGVLELGSYTADRGGSVQLRKSDIQIMFAVQGILYGIV